MSTTMSTTMTDTPTEAPQSTAPRNMKDSMKSTWRFADKSEWKHYHHTYERLGLCDTTVKDEAPVHQKTDKIAMIPDWQTHRWVIFHAAIPLVIQQAYVWTMGKNMHPIAVMALYSLIFIGIGIHQINFMRKMGKKYGYLDGDKHDRDGVPDHSAFKVLCSLVATVSFRQIMGVWLAYNSDQSPLQLNWLALPFEIGLYGIVLDFWFYWYHRAMHQIEGLWRYHRTHHLTKHPNPLLTLYADEEQEIFDIVGIPFLAYLSLKFMGFPMSYYEWWICYQYVVFSELAGHSGLRVHITTPSTFTPLLKYFNCELVIEDHDLHHRKGWKKSHNYGKQTRLWDRIFGTCADRIESIPANFDSTPGDWPLF